MSIFKINPMSAEEAYQACKGDKPKYHLFPKGQYEFKVIKVEPKISSKDNIQMFQVLLRLEAFQDGKPISNFTRDWLKFEGKTSFKLRHFCDSIGMSDDYEKGELNIELMIGKKGIADVYISKSTNPDYPEDYNSINDYVVDNTRVKKPVVKNEIIDDAIPF